MSEDRQWHGEIVSTVFGPSSIAYALVKINHPIQLEKGTPILLRRLDR